MPTPIFRDRLVRTISIIRIGIGALAPAAAVGLAGSARAAEQSQWASVDPAGKLIYKSLPAGDRIMDFSFAGYMGGGEKLPDVTVAKRVAPSGSDDTAAIQAAIDDVSKLEPTDGFRGAVLLLPGSYQCTASLAIKANGVVLRGSGADEKFGTTIKMSGPPHVCISVTGSQTSKDMGDSTPITDAYVPSGASTFHVGNAGGFAVGDTVRINRPVTAPWIAFIGMDKLVRSGKDEHWISGQTRMERTIKAISGNQFTVDVPLSDSLDAKFLNPPGASVIKYESQGALSRNGVEELRIVAPPQEVEITEAHYSGVHLDGLADGWVRNVTLLNMVGSVQIGGAAKRVTVTNVWTKHAAATKGAAKPADLAVDGTQTLFDRCLGDGENIFYFVTGARVIGPNVLLNSSFSGHGHIQPHQRWATGLLVDGCRVPQSGIEFMNRGEMGSGHGWTIGWSVAWNCTAKSFVIQQPPGSANWAIGCIGARETAPMPFEKSPILAEGIYDAHGTAVAPASLYLAQLRERLGPQALKNIGY